MQRHPIFPRPIRRRCIVKVCVCLCVLVLSVTYASMYN